MTTESELHALAEILGLVNIGDAASYLGEEAARIEERPCEHAPLSFLPPYENTTENKWCSFPHEIGQQIVLYKQRYAYDILDTIEEEHKEDFSPGVLSRIASGSYDKTA